MQLRKLYVDNKITSSILHSLCIDNIVQCFVIFFRQNSKTFREKSGAFRKLTKKYADLGKL